MHHWLPLADRMQPVAAARDWGLPEIVTVADLAAWMGLSLGELDWFADRDHLNQRRRDESEQSLRHHLDQRLRHYRYKLIFKSSGRVRLLEAPKPRLKEIQRRLLADILDRIPPHTAAYGFVRGRSIRGFAEPHTGRSVVLRLDLRDFFPSIPAPRIQALFRTLGYPEDVADTLAALCVATTPNDVWRTLSRASSSLAQPILDPQRVDPAAIHAARELYSRPHLPQGAPTSPALANACAYRLDCRLTALAKSAGAAYTRYADDLAFSGGDDFDRVVERFSAHVAAIVSDEGFAVHHRKTRIMRPAARQHLAGLVVNHHVNIDRRDYDRLKATLTNCTRRGPASQNRGAHPDFRAQLAGRIAFVASVNPQHGRRLRALFDAIHWDL